MNIHLHKSFILLPCEFYLKFADTCASMLYPLLIVKVKMSAGETTNDICNLLDTLNTGVLVEVYVI